MSFPFDIFSWNKTTYSFVTEKNWSSLKDRLNRKILTDTLNSFSVTNDELMLKKKKDEGLLDSVSAIKVSCNFPELQLSS